VHPRCPGSCEHADGLLAWSFWGLNIGLAMMVFMSLLPAGIYQAVASISHGLWYARSPEIVHSKVMETLVWLRVPGDIVFAAGGLLLAAYAARLLRGRRPYLGISVSQPAGR
jgi:nitric oxide reductase subunit B